MDSTIEAIIQECEQQGLLFLGCTDLKYPRDVEFFEKWLAEGKHGELRYLENHLSIRKNPEHLFPSAKSALILGLPYALNDLGDSPRVAQYARFVDYHRWFKKKVHALVSPFLEAGSFRVLVDSAPVLERALAAKTAHGFIGKNTLFIHPKFGSFLLLAEVLTIREFRPDTPPTIQADRKTTAGGCGPCQLCQVACPTGALVDAYSIDSTKCLSYWTIEQRGTIPEKFWPWLEQYYFGCDLCQLACPYNLKAPAPPVDWEKKTYPALPAVASMDAAQYEKFFGGTPMTRAKREGLRRNALIAMAVTRDPALESALSSIRPEDPPVLHQTAEQIRAFLSAPTSTTVAPKGKP
jgi:epoxyqueuosine reductase